jgi:hypothetical protein
MTTLIPTIDLVPLATCNAFQETVKGTKQDWVIRENVTGDKLGEFKARIADEDMFAILRFARKYELAALNTGVDLQRGKQDRLLNDENARLRQQLESIIAHNEMLAETVERLTTGE